MAQGQSKPAGRDPKTRNGGKAAGAGGRKRNPDKPPTPRKPDRNTFFGRVEGWWVTAETWERIYLLVAPVVILLTYLQGAGYLGVPRLLRGVLFGLTAYYLAIWFVVLLAIDRTVESTAGRMSRGSRLRAQDAVSARLGERKDAARAAEEIEQRNAEARRRGAIKAGLVPPDPAPPAAASDLGA